MKVSFKHQNKEILCLLILFRISRHWACFLSVAFSSCKLFGIEIFFIVLSTLFGSRTTFFFFFFYLPAYYDNSLYNRDVINTGTFLLVSRSGE